MNGLAINHELRIAARIAGFMYLFLGALAAFAEFYVRSGVIVSGDIALTAHNLIISDRLFRIGIACDLFGGACNAILAVAFYTLLRHVSSPLALLAAFWRVGESVILGHMTLNGMTALDILTVPGHPQEFSPGQLQALAAIFLGNQANEFSIGLVFYSLGSSLFCYLLIKSRFVPALLSWWGFVSSLVALVSTVVIIVFPSTDVIAPGCYAPVGIFEIFTGTWILTVGIKPPRTVITNPAPQ